jgi:hypothetical protein
MGGSKVKYLYVLQFFMLNQPPIDRRAYATLPLHPVVCVAQAIATFYLLQTIAIGFLSKF